MESDGWILAGLLALGVLLAAFCALAEMTLVSMGRQGFRQALATRQSRAQVAAELMSEPARLFSTLLALKVFSFILAVAATILLAQRGGARLTWSLVIIFCVLILTQVLPRAWAVGRQEALALRLAPGLHLLAIILSPLTVLMRRIGQGAAPAGAAAESLFLSEDGLRFLLNAGEEETVIEDDEKR